MSQLCSECCSKDKKIKVLQADIDFEIKKMTQDLAQQKVLLELQYQKEQKKINEKYMKEKQERQVQNKKWITKYDKIVEQYENNIQNLHKQYQKTSKQIKRQVEKQFIEKQEQTIQKHQHQLQSIKNQHQLIVITLKQSKTQQVQSLKKHQEQAINNLKNSQEVKMERIMNQYETKIKSLKKQLYEVTQSKNTLQKQASQKQASLYDQLYQKRREINDLKYQIDHLNSNISNCQEQIVLKNQQITKLKEKHQQNLRSVQKQFQNQKQKIIVGFKDQIESILLKKLQDYQHFEQNVRQIEIKRTNEVKLFQDSLNQVKVLVEQRPSRNQDVEQIKILKDTINQKDKQYEKILEVVKNYKLELNYKEQTFNRIFPAPVSQSPLNIERIGQRKERSVKSSQTQFREGVKYQTTKTIHTYQDLAKDKHRMTGTTLKLF